MVELVSALPASPHQTSGLEDIKVLGNRLTGDLETVLHGETHAQLGKSLPVSLVQLIQNGAPRLRGEGLEEGFHT